MNNLNSAISKPFKSPQAADKRAIEQPKTSSSKRAKREAENNKVKQEITVLIEQIQAPGITPQEVKDKEHQITLKKLEEYKIIHGHLKEDANKLYHQKKQIEAKVEELTLKLVSKEAEITKLTSDLDDTVEKMDLMENDLSIAQFDLLMTKEALEGSQKNWEATVAQMRAQHAKELKEKEDALELEKAVAGLSEGTTKAMRAKMAALVKKNKELTAQIKQQNTDIFTLRAENAELTESANHAEAELLVTQTATRRLLAQKHETESKYQSLLKDLTCIVERRK